MTQTAHTPGPWFVVEALEPPKYWIVQNPETWVHRVAAVPDYTLTATALAMMALATIGVTV